MKIDINDNNQEHWDYRDKGIWKTLTVRKK